MTQRQGRPKSNKFPSKKASRTVARPIAELAIYCCIMFRGGRRGGSQQVRAGRPAGKLASSGPLWTVPQQITSDAKRAKKMKVYVNKPFLAATARPRGVSPRTTWSYSEAVSGLCLDVAEIPGLPCRQTTDVCWSERLVLPGMVFVVMTYHNAVLSKLSDFTLVKQFSGIENSNNFHSIFSNNFQTVKQKLKYDKKAPLQHHLERSSPVRNVKAPNITLNVRVQEWAGRQAYLARPFDDRWCRSSVKSVPRPAWTDDDDNNISAWTSVWKVKSGWEENWFRAYQSLFAVGWLLEAYFPNK